MLFFLYGPDSFRRREKLKEYVAAHQVKNKSSFSLFRLDGADEGFLSEFSGSIESQSIFGGKKLIVAENVFGATRDIREKLLEILENGRDYFSGEEIFVFFSDNNVDRREKFFQYLIKHSSVYVFERLRGAHLEKWIKERAKRKNIILGREAAAALVSLTDNDSARLESELDKLSLFKPEGKIETTDIAEVVLGTGFNFFGLLDSFSAGDRKNFLLEAEKALLEGENPIGLVSALAGQARNVLLAWHFISVQKNSRELARDLGVHPFVAAKAMNFAAGRKRGDLENLFLRLVRADAAIKTGKIDPATAVILAI